MAALLLFLAPLPARAEDDKPATVMPGITIAPDRHGRGVVTFDLTQFDGGNGLLTSGIPFRDDPQPDCLSGSGVPTPSGLFTVSPDGASLVFRSIRADLPFAVEDTRSRDAKQVTWILSAPTCRVTITLEKEMRDGDAWVRLAPVD